MVAVFGIHQFCLERLAALAAAIRFSGTNRPEIKNGAKNDQQDGSSAVKQKNGSDFTHEGSPFQRRTSVGLL
jgi:hypothetical protein